MAIKYLGRDLQKRIIDGREVQKVMYNGVQIRPTSTPVPPFTPGPNTLAYFPLRYNFNDETGNFTLSNTGVNLTTFDDIPCAEFLSSLNKLETTTNLPLTGTDTFTLSMWAYCSGYSTSGLFSFGQPPSEVDPVTGQAIVGGNRAIGEFFNSGLLYTGCRWNDRNTGIQQPQGSSFTNYIFVQENNTVTIYELGRQAFQGTNYDYDIQAGHLVLGSDLVDWAMLSGYMNEVILEDKAWTLSDAVNYFNSSCQEYGYLPIN